MTDAPFDVAATHSLGHLRYVVEHRARLLPRIVRPAEAASTSTPLLPGGAAPAHRVGGQLVLS